MIARRLQLVLLAVLVGTPAVWAAIRHARAAEATELLLEAATAHERTSYRGWVLWNGGWKGKKVGVRHDAGSGRTAYRFGFFPEFVLAKPSSRMPDPTAFAIDPRSIARNYRAEERESAEFLGRAVRVIRVLPRNPGRPSLEVWVDRISGLPLKVSTFRADGSLYRVCKFDSVEFGPVEVREVNLSRSHHFMGVPASLDDPQAAAGFEPLLADYLPEGFRLVEARVRQRVTPQLIQTFSDGATVFELRQQPKATPGAIEAYYSKRGKMWAGMMVRKAEKRARERLVQAGDGEAATVVCRTRWGHKTFELRVDDLDLRLTARTDLDKEEMLKVLRSLRR